jgi:hypothetical protein
MVCLVPTIIGEFSVISTKRPGTEDAALWRRLEVKVLALSLMRSWKRSQARGPTIWWSSLRFCQPLALIVTPDKGSLLKRYRHWAGDVARIGLILGMASRPW